MSRPDLTGSVGQHSAAVFKATTEQLMMDCGECPPADCCFHMLRCYNRDVVDSGVVSLGLMLHTAGWSHSSELEKVAACMYRDVVTTSTQQHRTAFAAVHSE